MPPSPSQQVSHSIVIDADPASVFDVLATVVRRGRALVFIDDV